MENGNCIWKTSQHRRYLPSADMSPRQSSSSRLPAPEGKQVRQYVTGEKKAGSAFLQSCLEQGHDFRSSCITKWTACALQHETQYPLIGTADLSLEGLSILGTRAAGLAAIPPHTCPNTHLLCITAAQSPTGGLGLDLSHCQGGFPLWESLLPRCAELGCLYLLGCPSWNDNGNSGNSKLMLEVSG